ncbi:EAL domain-containing protein [Butyrivibrio sp. MC2021]|uniref:EAL domain-containing protein n=1 Tax=Butyrivibrio sp. MC2021 TaxID=1408306 RepID=UPI000684E924|nr:EAL domain-containing protein [Butyrivibrio sp. MC2021]
MDKYHYSETELNLIENSCIPMAVYQFIDRRVVTVAISRGFCDLFDIQDIKEAYDLMDNNMYRDTHPEDVVRISDAAYKFATEGGEYKVIYRSRKGGEYRIYRAHGKHVYKGDTRLAVVVYSEEGAFLDSEDSYADNLQQSLDKALRERTQAYNTNYDYLTGLPSMTYFFELAEAGREKLIASGQEPVVLFFDLSGMKNFNLKYGFSEGDKLIKEVAGSLRRHFSNENCGRFGGDHFAVFTARKGMEDQLVAIMKELKELNSGVTLPLRVGVYEVQDKHVEPSVACDRAKMACDSTRSSYVSGISFFNMDMLRREEKRQYVLENIDKAIENGWIRIFYQPIIRSANGKVSDEEALARWFDPEKGMIYPDEFIPVLEDARLIYKLDLYVVKQVLAKMKLQKENGFYVVPQSVNLSRADFFSCDIVEEIRKLVETAGIDTGKITIEITESLVASDIDFIKEQVDRFHELGFRVWMDDFGSGYSSPGLLQKIHFDTIKFDMEFMREFDNGKDGRIILSELLKMAGALGIETVVEGVETAEQAEFLREAGCTRLQGYYYSKPIPMEEVFECFKKGMKIEFETSEEAERYGAKDKDKVNMYDLTFTEMAQSLSSDYIYYYFVDLDSEEYVEYATDGRGNILSAGAKGDDFFAKSYKNAADVIFEEDLEEFRKSFTKENVVRRIESSGSYTYTYRLKLDGRPTYVHMKAGRSKGSKNGMVIGVSNIDAQKKQQEAFERLKEEQITYNRVAALSGDIVAIYTVNPETDSYYKYVENKRFKGLGISSTGDRFFEVFRESGRKNIFIEDVDQFMDSFTREKVLAGVEKNKIFSMNFRVMVSGDPKYVSLKAAMVKAKGGRELVIGLLNIDDQMRRDMEYAKNLSAARNEANLDALTGVKNRHAYIDIEEQMDKLIDEKKITDFAVVVCDINGLKEINDTYGHSAGDEYIKNGCDMICGVFRHSPVFRVGGDEFVVIVQGRGFANINKLMQLVEEKNEESMRKGGVVVAAGVSLFKNDTSVASVFERADADMYENKVRLKIKQKDLEK